MPCPSGAASYVAAWADGATARALRTSAVPVAATPTRRMVISMASFPLHQRESLESTPAVVRDSVVVRTHRGRCSDSPLLEGHTVAGQRRALTGFPHARA